MKTQVLSYIYRLSKLYHQGSPHSTVYGDSFSLAVGKKYVIFYYSVPQQKLPRKS